MPGPCLAEDLLLAVLVLAVRRDPDARADLVAIADGFDVRATADGVSADEAERFRELAHAARVAILQADTGAEFEPPARLPPRLRLLNGMDKD